MLDKTGLSTIDRNSELLSSDLSGGERSKNLGLAPPSLWEKSAHSSNLVSLLDSPASPPISRLASPAPVVPLVPAPSNINIEVIGATWIAQGPAPAINGQTENVVPSNQVIGAIHTVVAHPTNPNILWVGGVNGGIWRTNNATAASPTWTPLTDRLRGLSIGAMALDPTDLDPEGDGLTIVAGIGRFSSYAQVGGPLAGLLLSTNGGTTFTQISPPELQGRNISGVARRGNTLLVSANNFGGGTGGGVYRSTDNGATWTFLSGTNGLPSGAAFDLVGDPTNNQRFYVSIQGVGIFRSDNGGATWTNASSGDAALNTAITTAGNNNTEMAVSPVNGRIYVGVLRNGRPVYIGFSDAQGVTWTQMDLPVTQESNGDLEGLSPREKAGGQGNIHFSIVADPTNTNLVYVGGDRQDFPFPNAIGANDFSGRLFRGDTTQAAVAPGSQTNINSPQWRPLTHGPGGFGPGGGTASNSSPHADSREMTFDASGNLIQVDDGGIYRRTNPRNATGDWFSIIGNLQLTEQHDIAYDTISNILISGNQDTGTTQQIATGSQIWDSVSVADGGDVAVSVNPANPTQSVRYSSFQNLRGFQRNVYSATNTLISTTLAGLVGFDFDTDGSGPDTGDEQFNTPISINAVNPNRLIIGGATRVYESFNQGDTVTVVNTSIGGSVGVNSLIGDPIAYGGRRGGVDNPDVLYVGSGNRVFVRTTAGGALVNTAYAGNSVRGIALDTNDWQVAFAIDNSRVFQTSNAGISWVDITGDLSSLLDFSSLAGDYLVSIDFVAGSTGAGSTLDAIVIGTTRGVFAALSNDYRDWFAVGPTTLPNAPVWDMDFDPTDNILALGTLGRGAWTLANIRNLVNSAPTPNAGSSYTVSEGGTVQLSALGSSDPNGLALTFSWDLDNDGIFGETGAAAGRGNEVGATPLYSAVGLDGVGVRTVRLRATNSQGSSATTTASINILNVVPTITNLSLSSTTINENDTLVLTGTFTDPGLPDTHTIAIAWGDGTTSFIPINQNTLSRTFQISHQYLDDNPSGTSFDILPITVSVTDDDGASTQTSTSVRVNNLNPVITSFVSNATLNNIVQIGQPVLINATFTDVGRFDTHRAFVDWGDGTPVQEVTVFQGSGSGVVQGTHIYTRSGFFTVSLAVQDDDIEADSEATNVIIFGITSGFEGNTEVADVINNPNNFYLSGLFYPEEI